jgi:hypothetical protein
VELRRVATITEAEIDIRMPVWCTLSDLFLDTETRWDIGHHAKVCAESPFDRNQLEQIYWNELAPTLGANLLMVAGEWAVFPEEFLREKIPQNITKPGGWKSFIQRRWFSTGEECIKATLDLTEWMRVMTTEERKRYADVWRALGELSFQPVRDQESAKRRLAEIDGAAEIWKRIAPLMQSVRYSSDESWAKISARCDAAVETQSR